MKQTNKKYYCVTMHTFRSNIAKKASKLMQAFSDI